MELYKEYLNQEIENACKRFEESKVRIIYDLNHLTVDVAAKHGARLSGQITNLTKLAAEIERLSQEFEVLERIERGAYTKIE